MGGHLSILTGVVAIGNGKSSLSSLHVNDRNIFVLLFIAVFKRAAAII